MSASIEPWLDGASAPVQHAEPVWLHDRLPLEEIVDSEAEPGPSHEPGLPATEPDDSHAPTPLRPRRWAPWPTWDAASACPGAVHGPRRDRPDGAKDIPWPRGARPAELIYFATADHRPPDPGSALVLVEGEKAADAVTEAGLIGVGTVCGASSDPDDAVLELLARYRLTLSPDNDALGRRHMSRIARRLEQLGVAECRWVAPPDDAPDHWDLADVDSTRRRELVEGAHELPMIPDEPVAFPGSEDRGLAVPPSPDNHSGTGDAPAAGMKFSTARDLFAGLPETTVWRVAGLVPDGAIAELDGPAKRAGKTTFLAHLIRSVLDGTPFLGRETRKGPVVMLSEQPVASLRASLAPAGLLERDDLFILVWGDAIGVPWQRVAAEALELCASVGAVLLAVDTLPQWAGLRGDAENDAGAALQAIEPLQRAAAAGLAVIVVRHDRKGSGDVGESARGSSAFGGAVDVILQLRRGGPEERSTIRYLSALSRFPDTPEQLVVELVNDSGGAAGMNSPRYVELGDVAEYTAAVGKQAVLVAIGAAELRRADIEGATGISGERLTVLLAELVASGYLERAGRGVKGDPQRFRRMVPIHSGGSPTTWDPPVGMESAPAEPDYVAEALDIFGDVLVDGADR